MAARLSVLVLLLFAFFASVVVEAFIQQPQPQVHLSSRNAPCRPGAAAGAPTTTAAHPSSLPGVSRLYGTSIVQSSPEFSQLKQLQVGHGVDG